MPLREKVALVVVPGMLSLSAWTGDDAAAPPPPESRSEAGPGSPGSTPRGVTIEVTFAGSTVTPNGERIEVQHGHDVTLPERELEYDAGTTELRIPNLDQPGVVDVESHDLDKVIVQLEVR
jgi:hypothetical protein